MWLVLHPLLHELANDVGHRPPLPERLPAQPLVLCTLELHDGSHKHVSISGLWLLRRHVLMLSLTDVTMLE